LGGFPEAFEQGGRPNDGGVAAPTKDPAFDFLETAEVHGEFEFAAVEWMEFLGGMPFALGNQTRGKRIETDADAVFGAAFEDAEAIAEMGGDGEIGGAAEAGLGVARMAHAREREGADLAAGEIEAEEIPLVLDAAEVVGLDAPGFVPGATEFLVLELEFVGVEERVADDFEELDVGLGRAEAAEGDGGINVAPLKADAVFQPIGDFCEGGLETFFEGGAAVLLKGFLGDEEGDDLAFGDLDPWKIGDRLGVNESEMELVILDGQPHAVPHEIDVALDGLAGDFQFVGELAAIGEGTGFEALVEAQHARQWRAGLDADATWSGTGETRHVLVVGSSLGPSKGRMAAVPRKTKVGTGGGGEG
jgi:hypothetical protein